MKTFLFIIGFVLFPSLAHSENISPEAKESFYVNKYCRGTTEYKLDDGTRADCLTREHIMEFDFAHKWYEGLGQALHYSVKTGKRPAVCLIYKKHDDMRYVNRLFDVIMTFGISMDIYIINMNRNMIKLITDK